MCEKLTYKEARVVVTPYSPLVSMATLDMNYIYPRLQAPLSFQLRTKRAGSLALKIMCDLTSS